MKVTMRHSIAAFFMAVVMLSILVRGQQPAAPAAIVLKPAAVLDP